MKHVKAILIDAVNRVVREVEVPAEGLKEVYALLGEGTTLVTGAVYLREDEEGSDLLLVDDEGLLNPDKSAGFLYKGAPQPYVGSGIIMGGNEDGETCSVKMDMEVVREAVSWLNKEQVETLQEQFQ
jgi:hypothetical protein